MINEKSSVDLVEEKICAFVLCRVNIILISLLLNNNYINSNDITSNWNNTRTSIKEIFMKYVMF